MTFKEAIGMRVKLSKDLAGRMIWSSQPKQINQESVA